ncbi:MAG: hypothetical protein ACR2QR_03305, partial [Woeseiaceae bacterium]
YSEPRPIARKRNFAYLSGGAKVVDGLVNPDDSFALDESDSAFEVLLAGNISLWSPGRTSNLSLGANIFREDYTDFSAYDLQMIGLNTQFEQRLGIHDLKFQVGISDTSLGGDDYLGFTDFGVSDTLPLNDGWDLQISGLYRDVKANSALYAHFAGDLIQMTLGLRGREQSPWRFDYTYRNEDRGTQTVEYLNDNDDVFEGLLVYSRSSHRVRGHYELQWNENMGQSFSVGVRATEYADANQFLAIGSDSFLTEMIRDAIRLNLETELSWALTDRFRILGRLEWFDEDSNIDQYDFSSTQIGIGLDYLF